MHALKEAAEEEQKTPAYAYLRHTHMRSALLSAYLSIYADARP
jgi:hypothetical protein